MFSTWSRIILVRFPHPDVIGFTIKLRLACVYAFVTCSTERALLLRHSSKPSCGTTQDNATRSRYRERFCGAATKIDIHVRRHIRMLVIAGSLSRVQQVSWNMTFYQSKNYLFAPSFVVSNVNTSKESAATDLNICRTEFF